MASVENLVDALEQYHVHYFLIIYLTLIQQGCSLEVPQSIELERVSFQWKNALPKQCQHAPDSFIQELSKLWISLIRNLGEPPSKNSINYLLTELKKDKAASLAVVDPALMQSPLSGMNPQLDQVSSNISSLYQLDSKIRHQEKIPNSKLISLLKISLTDLNAADFLNYHLQLSINKKQLNIPKTSILHEIKSQWSQIIKKTYKLNPDTNFIDSLTKEWFRVVNKLGLPVNLSHLNETYIDIRRFQETQLQNETPSKKPMTKRKKKWYETIQELLTKI